MTSVVCLEKIRSKSVLSVIMRSNWIRCPRLDFGFIFGVLYIYMYGDMSPYRNVRTELESDVWHTGGCQNLCLKSLDSPHWKFFFQEKVGMVPCYAWWDSICFMKMKKEKKPHNVDRMKESNRKKYPYWNEQYSKLGNLSLNLWSIHSPRIKVIGLLFVNSHSTV